MKAIIFDFDWVIHNTFEFHRNKIEEYFKITFTVENFKSVHDWNIFLDIPEEFKHLEWAWYGDYIYGDYTIQILDQDIKSILNDLSKKYTLHIITSWRVRNITDYLKNNQIYDIFGEILCYEFHKSKIFKFKHIFEKHNLKPEDCIFVTDTLWDILEANQVGIKTIAIDSGYHERERLVKWNPYKIISKFNELNDLLKNNNETI